MKNCIFVLQSIYGLLSKFLDCVSKMYQIICENQIIILKSEINNEISIQHAHFLIYTDVFNQCTVPNVLRVLPDTCHNFRTEAFQIPVKPFLFENRDLFGNAVIALYDLEA